jgi:hypothetical protein
MLSRLLSNIPIESEFITSASVGGLPCAALVPAFIRMDERLPFRGSLSGNTQKNRVPATLWKSLPQERSSGS